MKKKTIKKLIIIFVIFAVIVSAGLFYVNKFFLPTKIKSLIIQALETQTQKKVSLEDMKLDIFKGLVLKSLTIYDETKTIVYLKEASCTFLLLPLIKEKKVIIPNIRLVSPKVFLERRKDNTFNLVEFLPKKITPKQKPKLEVLIYRVNITGANIDFQDSSFSPAFSKRIENLNLSLNLALPVSVKFNLKSSILGNLAITLAAEGEYKIPDQQLLGTIKINNLNPKEFSVYYLNLTDIIKEAMLDSQIKFNLKDNVLNASSEIQIKSLIFSKDKISGKSDASLKADILYGLKDKKFDYSAILTIAKLDVSGIERIDKIENINGLINIKPDSLNSEKLNLSVWGLPAQAKLNLTNFSSPALSLNLYADLDLSKTKEILADKLKLSIPAGLQGSGKLTIDLVTDIPTKKTPDIKGSFDVTGAQATIDKIKEPFTNINGHIDFDLKTVSWKKISADYLGKTYLSNGTLKNFNAPNISFDLSSDELSLESQLNIKDKTFNIARLKGRYLNSDFVAEGSIDTTNADSPMVNIDAGINLDIQDIKKPLVKFKDTIEKIKPNGILNTELNIEGNIKDFKSCAIKAKLSSPSLSLYGLKTQDFNMNYNQSQGVGDIPLLHASLYDGTIDANGKINLSTENFPYWLSMNVDGLKIEKLKNDTPIAAKDIAGTIQAQAKVSGFVNDYSKLSGAGKITITNGKLWQLNLFSGMGELLFTKDFANIIFNEGYCEFFIKDKFIFTEDLRLTSNLVSLSGAGKIGFDSSLEASINVTMSDEMIPTDKSAIKAVTTAIIGQAGKFAVIKLSGTLRQPKYSFQPAVGNVIKGLKDFVIGSIFGE